MEPIDRILACSARFFGLSPLRRRGAPPAENAEELDALDAAMLECCAAEGLAAERLMREARDGQAR